jgi:multisubunit Na+/H+ antiporter MnhE subunit
VIALLLRVASLVALYLLVLTSLDPGDVLVGTLIAFGLVLAAGPAGARGDAVGWSQWAASFARMVASTAREMAVGTLRVVRFCITGAGQPGFVEIPRGDRSRRGVALWGVLTGEAPDEYPDDVDDEHQVLIVHTIDAADPDAIRARHAAAREAYGRDVVA